MSTDVERTADALTEFLDSGVSRGLFTAGAAGISTSGARVLEYAGALSEEDTTRTAPETLFDLASITKTFVATVAVRLIADGRIDPAAPLSDIAGGRLGDNLRGATVHQLLTHTSGLPAESFEWRAGGGDAEQRLHRVLQTPLQSAPGAMHRYSDPGYVALGATLEVATGQSLGHLIDLHVSRVLGLRSLGYGPRDRATCAATEDESYIGRGVVRGEVHDELAWFLGGRTGNAGLFASASDVLTFAESFLTNSVLDAESRRLMATNRLTSEQMTEPYGQGYGPRTDDPSFMGPLRGFGHTGFTGTMWVTHPSADLAAVLLTNRVHPHRTRGDIGPYRREFGVLLSEFLG